MLQATAGIPGAVPVSEQAGVTLRPIRLSDAKTISKWLCGLAPAENPLPFTSEGRVRGWILKKNEGDNRGRHYIIVHRGKNAGLLGWLNTCKFIIFLAPHVPRRQGIGKKAVRLAVHLAKMENRFRLVAVAPVAIDFFMKCGFKEEVSGARYQMTRAERAAGCAYLTLRLKGSRKHFWGPSEVPYNRQPGFTKRIHFNGLA